MNQLTNIITGTILATLLLTVTGAALAQDPMANPAGAKKGQHHQGRHQQRRDQPMPAVENMMRAVKHLDLSDEQQESIKAIMPERYIRLLWYQWLIPAPMMRSAQ